MKRWLLIVLRIVIFPAGVSWYCTKVLEYRKILMAQIGHEYGQKQWRNQRVVRIVFWRTLFWWTKPERFFKKQTAWGRHCAALEDAYAARTAKQVEALTVKE